ncbi:MAG: ExbD/TolR family protein [Candidatus Acidiferrales bacterium]
MSRDLTRKDAGLLLGSPGAPSATCIDERGRLWSPRLRRIARERKRESAYYCQIDTSAISGVFVVLLFIMMIASAPTCDPCGVAVDLFQGKNGVPKPWALRYDAMIVTVTRDGHYYFGSRQIAIDELPARFRESVGGGSERRVYLKVDARSRYTDTKTVLDEVRLAGITNVTFQTFPVEILPH